MNKKEKLKRLQTSLSPEQYNRIVKYKKELWCLTDASLLKEIIKDWLRFKENK